MTRCRFNKGVSNVNTLRVAFLAVAVAFVAAGCSTTKLDDKPATPDVNAAPAQAPAPAPAPAPVKQVDTTPMAPIDPLNDPKNILSRRSVYFEFDRSSINETDVAVVEAHGRYLVDHGARTVRIEGNCDERGGREYNLALGQRRADAVRERLKVLGVATNRVETVSLGKEKPRNTGHAEAAWAENRRADIVYK
jgi:peptidoglycan-associated lipoprotein